MISKGIFLKYEEIRMSGKYNMFMDAAEVIKIMNISVEQYKDIVSNYSKYKEKFLGGK